MICTKSTVKAVEGDTVAYETEGKTEAFAGVDTVILATGMQPLDNLSEALKAKGIETFVIGDAKEVGYMIDANHAALYGGKGRAFAAAEGSHQKHRSCVFQYEKHRGHAPFLP